MNNLPSSDTFRQLSNLMVTLYSNDQRLFNEVISPKHSSIVELLDIRNITFDSKYCYMSMEYLKLRCPGDKPFYSLDQIKVPVNDILNFVDRVNGDV